MPDLVDRVVVVPDAESIAGARMLSAIIGRPCGGSTGTNICAVFALIQEMLEKGQRGSIVTLLCDSGDRYKSTLYDDHWLVSQQLDIAPMMQRLETVFGEAH